LLVSLQVLEEVDELMGPSLLPVTKQLLHHASMPPYTQRQTIALGSSALPQQQLLAAAADALRPSAVVVRATWPLTQQQAPAQQRQQNSLASGAAPLAALLADPAAALAAAAATSAAAIAPNVSQRFVGVAPQLKHRTLLRLLSGVASGGGGGVGAVSQGPTVVFTNSAAAADEVVSQLEAAGVGAGALHNVRSQNQREEALQCFQFGVTQVLVACGVAYRGLDLPDVSVVVNYEVPLSLAEYARRCGLVGRQGRDGTAVTLVTPADGPAVVPLVSFLMETGQAVPDWLAAVAAASGSGTEGSSSSSTAPREGDAVSVNSSAAAAAAADGVDLVIKKQSLVQGRQQQSSAAFTAKQPGLQFGRYSSSGSSSTRSKESRQADG
jgi:superfamily II DNA/RNA helicase